MHCFIILNLFFVKVISHKSNGLLIDYVSHKGVPGIVVYHCNNSNDGTLVTTRIVQFFHGKAFFLENWKLQKRLSAANITTTLVGPDECSPDDIGRSLQTKYHRLGIFLDLRCLGEKFFSSVLSQMSGIITKKKKHFNWFDCKICYKSLI